MVTHTCTGIVNELPDSKSIVMVSSVDDTEHRPDGSTELTGFPPDAYP